MALFFVSSAASRRSHDRGFVLDIGPGQAHECTENCVRYPFILVDSLPMTSKKIILSTKPHSADSEIVTLANSILLSHKSILRAHPAGGTSLTLTCGQRAARNVHNEV